MPTAVMIESSEKTMSMTMIWAMTASSVDLAAADLVLLVAFERLVDLAGALPEQEQAASDAG